MEYFEIFSHPQENQLARQFFVNLICYCSFAFPNVLSVIYAYMEEYLIDGFLKTTTLYNK